MPTRKIALVAEGEFVYISDDNNPIPERKDEKDIDLRTVRPRVDSIGLRAVHGCESGQWNDRQ
jgi:hypothetical protein